MNKIGRDHTREEQERYFAKKDGKPWTPTPMKDDWLTRIWPKWLKSAYMGSNHRGSPW